MLIKKFKIIAITALTGLLTGCAKEPPKCSDDATLSMVKHLFSKQLKNQEITEKESEENIKLEFPLASAYDEKIKKYSCTAQLSIGNNYRLPITYESQLDDKNEHIVSLGNILALDLFYAKNFLMAVVKKNRDVQENIAVAPEKLANVTTTSTPETKQAETAITKEPLAEFQNLTDVDKKISPLLGRCHMDLCSWSKTLDKKEISSDNRGKLLQLTLLGGTSDFNSEETVISDDPSKITWNKSPHQIYIFCSTKLPAVLMLSDSKEKYEVDVFDFWSGVPGVLESSAGLYRANCHPSESNLSEDALAKKYNYIQSPNTDIDISKPTDIFNFVKTEPTENNPQNFESSPVNTTELDEANNRINLVWNSTTKIIRKSLLTEQRAWLKQRENDCSAQADKIHCMAAMTDQRTEELKQKIAALLLKI